MFRDDSRTTRGSGARAWKRLLGPGWDGTCSALSYDKPNHFHLLVRTPRPNLSRGMQHLTSGYANWCSRRHRRPGHTFQGRFKSELIEDEGAYFWTVQPLHPPQSRAGQTPARRTPAQLALVELSGLRPPAAAHVMGGLRGFAFGLAWRVGRQRSPEAAYRRFVDRTGEGSGKPLSVLPF